MTCAFNRFFVCLSGGYFFFEGRVQQVSRSVKNGSRVGWAVKPNIPKNVGLHSPTYNFYSGSCIEVQQVNRSVKSGRISKEQEGLSSPFRRILQKAELR